MPFKKKRILITGASGFLGSNLVREMKSQGYAGLQLPAHRDFDLTVQDQVRAMILKYHPDIVIHLAGLVGGILINKEKPADFFYHNLMMGTLMLHESWQGSVEKFVTCIGGCSYPAHASSPIPEDALWEGYPQPESAPYSIAKKMSVVQSQAYRAQYGFNSVVLVPGNLYGPFDNFDLKNSHVIPALIRKVFEAKKRGDSQFQVWGTGKPIRDFIYVGDAVKAIIQALEIYNESEIINISSGIETSIRELVDTIVELVGFQGEVVWDQSKPDGQMRKGFDVKRMNEKLHYTCSTSLRDGLMRTIQWFEQNYDSGSIRL